MSEVANVVAHLAGRFIRKLLWRDKVTASELPSIDTKFTGGIIHGPLQHINRLRTPCATIGIHLRRVGVNPSDLQMRHLNIVKTG